MFFLSIAEVFNTALTESTICIKMIKYIEFKFLLGQIVQPANGVDVLLNRSLFEDVVT